MGSLRFVPARAADPASWTLLAAWPALVLLPSTTATEVVDAVWASVAGDPPDPPTLETVVSSIPLGGADAVESFAVVFLPPHGVGTASVVVRGSASVDLHSVGGARRFGSGGVEPWALAEFPAVTAVALGRLAPVPESGLRPPPGARRFEHGVVEASEVVWAHDATLWETGAANADVSDTVVGAPRVSLPDDSEIEAPALPLPLFELSVNGGPAHPLEGPVVIGRRPTPPPSQGLGGLSTDARPPTVITVPSPSGEVSARHVEIVRSGRTVVITDLRSTNGTRVTLPGGISLRLRQGDSAVATRSAIVEIGDGNVIHISSPVPSSPGMSV
ncbi:FHA domain-containing protein [Herbiconiux sp. KACC 21604]|uniref:FHA domain-containing protein n=1 Tax=unclassified Herbiconiux TaxID=2618217 RepID=UPI001492BBE6|nr:FHA domain-containing protein [Herbiconiux sp. SALV-R1]QJU53244.1 FHA domain-containing protein [Herbiconiux sp. SALV-R1]WPO88203.1 FHA domain-containing protein [Herbiconiux sp. KACC 21604]